ncbi:MAG: proprotein convertase P-domain-containing protein [Bacteroidia bacterium]|nr:proprotein convertase P-domain-containing protein [Bacteroidia bacterium]
MAIACPPSTKWFRIVFFLLLWTITASVSVNGQDSHSYWSEWSADRYRTAPSRYTTAAAYKAYRLDLNRIKAVLSNAPREFTVLASASPVAMHLPLPDGRMAGFRMVESSVMDPALAAAYPGIKTYSGQGVDDPSSILKVSITPFGLHAMILSPSGSFFIDPWEQFNTADYIVYEKGDLQSYRSFSCETDTLALNKGRTFTPIAGGQTNRSHGTQLRNYRLALACTGEYAAVFGGTKAGALAAMVVSMNRVNGIYESEVAVRMTLIPNDTLIIYTNGATDPYTNSNGSTMLGQNQTNIDGVIGSANYDVGHVFSTGGGGVAQLNVPCVSGSKARGVTGLGSPVGDAFDVDYVAHEMGHQFGALHTFNSSTGSCSGNRSASAAFEPGSGITIMAYAGICGTDNLDAHSIAYFHTYSFDQIVTFITTGAGNTCPVNTATGNNPPTVTPAGLLYNIPFQTPFVLTATGSDPNNDPLTYSWEEFDLGTAGAWNNPTGNAPIFRPFSPVSSGSRTFPKLSDILNNTTTIGEILPTYARTLKFRVTVRDNRVGGGGVMHIDDTVKVNVINTTTPFSVTAPNTALTWFAGQNANVSWNVSSTHLAPISCASVNILLSTDGGNTFPITLLSGTANDGTENIVVPVAITNQARVKVEAAGNIFFDISNANFTIQSGSAVLTSLSTDVISPTGLCAGQALNVSFAGDGPPNSGNTYTAQLSNASGSFAAPVAIGSLSSTSSTGTISCIIPAGTVQGTGYRIRVMASNPAVTGTNNGADLSIFAPLGSTNTVSGSATVCQGQSGLVYSIAPVLNATSYAWTLPAGFTITSGSGTPSITVSISAGAGGGIISVVPSNPCQTGAASSGFSVSVNPLPAAAGPVSGSSVVCAGQSGVQYSLAPVSNAVSYAWTLPAGASVVAGAGTNVITVDFGPFAVSGNISVQGVNACGSGTASILSITVGVTPVAPLISAAGSTTVCSPNTVSLTFTPSPGLNYQWRKDGVPIHGATASSYQAASAGNYDVVASIQAVGSQLFTNNTAVSIPDNSCTGGSSSISVSGYNFPVRSSGIYLRMNITHTYVGDLDIFLEAPNGQRLGLSDQTGNGNNGGDNFTNTVFADSGTAILPTSGAPYTGLYKPWNAVFTVSSCAISTGLTSFAGFNGGAILPNGTWSLRAYDRFTTDVGSITSWSLFMPYFSSTCTAVSNTVSVTVNAPPLISSFSPATGTAGTLVTINGSGFSGANSLAFNGVPAAGFTVVNDGQITATVPAGATTGPLSVSTACGTAVSAASFNIPSFLTLNLTVLVQGLYNGGGNMRAVISPTQSDSVTVELHQALAPYATVYSSTAAMNLAGQTSLNIPSGFNGNSYYIVVRHRNALETWSKWPVLFGPVINYNFKQ